MKKTVHCRICKCIHKMEDKYRYYCPGVFGGWVYIRKNKPPIKIVNFRKCLTHRLDGQWEWSCPIWFSKGMFADATINNARLLNTKEEAVKDMTKTMKKFGVTKQTETL